MNKIIEGDCLEVMKELKDNSVDLIITDPPYGVEFQENRFFDDSKDYVFGNAEKWIKEMSRLLKDKCHIYMFTPNLEIDKWVFLIKKYFRFKNLLATSIYTTNRYLKNNFTYDLQLIIFASNGAGKRLNKVDWIKTSEDWLKDKRNKSPHLYTYQYPSYIPKKYRANVKPNFHKNVLHPNQKSVELLEKFVRLSSKKGEIVLDPFSGSGSTAVACKMTNRKYIGIEKNAKYVKISRERLKEEKLRRKRQNKLM